MNFASFSTEIDGTMSPRELLGLPNHFVPSYLESEVARLYPSLARFSTESLVATIENDPRLERRLAAGRLLSLLGDPRIETFTPTMMEVPECPATLGLPSSKVDEVFEQYRGLGIARDWIVKECPEYQIHLRSFRIAKYPVTNLEFREYLIDTCATSIPSSWALGKFPAECSSHPVAGVTADAADAYALWLARKTGRSFRLPSEAEWEFAAAGLEGNEFPWGNEFIVGLANTAELGLFSSTPVGLFGAGASTCGALDMAGNVEEYVSDPYRPYLNGIVIEDALYVRDPAYRIARGGSFSRFRDLARTRRRHGYFPKDEIYSIGFRLAETVQ